VKVSLFITCFNDALFPQTGQAVVKVLERVGCEVEFRPAQTCCGQMHHNSGYKPEATDLVRRFAETFADAETIVVPSTSCAGMIRGQYPRLAREAGDTALLAQVEAIGARVFEFTEFLTDRLGLEDVGAYYPHKVVYHSSCNSLRSLKLGDRPLRLLRKVRGLELATLERAEECCGFGGTFAVKNAETSTAMLADKMRHVRDSGAEVCTAGDNSCLMHIGGGLSRLRAGVRTVHLAEILASTEQDRAA
jgi:L-lactate dehydrogenase complex protein LldE